MYKHDVDGQLWHYSHRIDDDHASICTDNGICIAIRPRLLTNEEWKPIAHYICGLHNEKLCEFNEPERY